MSPTSSSFSSTDGRARAVFAALLLTACTPKPIPPSDEVTVRRQEHMTTYVTITVATPEKPAVVAAIDAAFAEIARLELLLSEWKADSEISKVNAAAGKQAVPVGKELFGVICTAHQVAVASDGAFDITMASFWGLWDFKSMRPEIPSDAAISERLARTGYRGVELDNAKSAVKLRRDGMLIGLGGIAKGYAVDGASRVLRARGYPHHLIVAGGDLYASGRKATRKWNIGVRHPRAPGLYATLEVEDEGVATSGDYERFFVKEGKRFHHILDPKTGRPARKASSATVIARDATLADAFATAMLVKGVEAGLQLAASRDDLEVLLFAADGQTPHPTAAMKTRLIRVEAAAPPDATPHGHGNAEDQ